ncbi:MAG: lysophospholipid acyltransferase family protein [Sulfurimicrobium sp.]
MLGLVYEYIILYGGLLLFALISLSWSLIAAVLAPILPRRIAAPLGQLAIMLGFRFYLAVLKISGLVHLDLGDLDALRDEGALIIAPNHPSLIDVGLIASRLPNFVCIMKASIWDNLLLGGCARLAGYIRNDAPRDMIRLAATAAREGRQLLIFPEGTRTLTPPVNDFKGGFGLIAKKAGVPVQTVFIETNSPFLGKGWPLLKKPDFPLVYRVRLGQRFEVKGEVKTFITKLEQYFRQQPGIRNFTREDGGQDL